MSISLIVDKLNNQVKSLKSDKLNATFYFGQGVVTTSEIAKKIVPFGKVAVLYYKQGYHKNGKNFATLIKGGGNPVTHVVLPDNFNDSIEDFSHLFNLAEDIRVLVATDPKLYTCAKYFCSQRNIPCILVVDTLNFYNLLSPVVTLKNAGVSQNITLNVNAHVVIDYEAIKMRPNDYADAYAFIVSHALALTDYRINLLIKSKKPNKTAFSIALNAVTKTYPLFTFEKKDMALKLIFNLMSLETANALTSGQIYQCFSGAVASNLIESSFENQGKNRLISSVKIAIFYKLWLSGDFDKILSTPNYLERVNVICEKLKIDRPLATNQLVNQSKTISANVRKVNKLMQKIQKDILSFIDCSTTMQNTFTALGGDVTIENSVRDLAIKHSGDLFLNGMSLVRESGIAEYI